MWHPLYVESKKKWYKWTQLQNKKTLTDLENDLWFPGLGIVRDFGKVMNTLINFKWITTKTYCVAHGTQFSDIRQPRWDGSPGENGYMYMYGWVSSLFTWNRHNIVNQLNPNTRWKVQKRKKRLKITCLSQEARKSRIWVQGPLSDGWEGLLCKQFGKTIEREYLRDTTGCKTTYFYGAHSCRRVSLPLAPI